MKKISLIFIALSAVAMSCSNEDVQKTQPPAVDVTPAAGYAGAYNLTQVQSGFTSTATTGVSMPFQEKRTLNPDKTFTTTQTFGGTVTNGSGTYQTVTISGNKYLSFTYLTGNNAVTGCESKRSENARITTTGFQIDQSLYDGPNLTYSKF